MSGAPEITTEAVALIITDTRTFGRRSLETGGFLLLPRSAHTISLVAFAGETGIVRRCDLFEISAGALDRLFVFADEHDLLAPIQFHSHRLYEFMSRTDREHGLRAEGFVSVIVPRYENPSNSVATWGWWRFESGAWAATESCPMTTGATSAVEFDEAGVRER